MNISKLRKLREQSKMSREELAVKLSVSVQTIYRWEEKEIKPHKIFQEKLNRIFPEVKDGKA